MKLAELKPLLEEFKFLSDDEVEAILRENCMKAVNFYHKSIFRLYRNVDADSSHLFEPRLRKSLTDSNRILDLTAELPSWNKYPKRNMSLFMSTSMESAQKFDGNTFIVFPFDGAKLGITPKEDFNYEPNFQWAKANFLPPIGNDLVDVFFNIFFMIRGYHGDSGKITQVCKAVDEIIKKDGVAYFDAVDGPNKDKVNLYGEELSFHNRMLKLMARDGAFKAIDDIMDPNKNNFVLAPMEYIDGVSEREVWTDSKCVLVPEEKINSYMQKFFPKEQTKKTVKS